MGTRSRTGKRSRKSIVELPGSTSSGTQPLWQSDFAEVTGHKLESRGRKEVNQLLAAGVTEGPRCGNSRGTVTCVTATPATVCHAESATRNGIAGEPAKSALTLGS